MPMVLTLPDDLAAPLRRAAAAQGRTTEDVALDIPRAGLLDAPDGGDEPDLATIVAAIRALPPNPRVLRPGRGSPADAFAPLVSDEPFGLAAWEADWAMVEAEMAATMRADDRAEGRA
jgi:plasmid stability protein